MRKLKIILIFVCVFLGGIHFQTPVIQAAQEKEISKKTTSAKEKLRLNITKLNMTKDANYMLRVYNTKKKYTVAFSSSDESVVSFLSRSSKGRRAKLSAENIGNAVITVTVKKNRRVITRLKCHVTVSPQAVSIKFPKQEITMGKGESKTIRPIIKPNTSTEKPTYISSNTAVATINSKGKVTALSEGTVQITAVLSTGQSASYTIIIKENEETEPLPSPTTNSITVINVQ